jgi:hypothetical protein
VLASGATVLTSLHVHVRWVYGHVLMHQPVEYEKVWAEQCRIGPHPIAVAIPSLRHIFLTSDSACHDTFWEVKRANNGIPTVEALSKLVGKEMTKKMLDVDWSIV